MSAKFLDQIKGAANCFVQNTINDLDTTLEEVEKLFQLQDDYDVYCKFILKKTQTVGRYKTIGMLVTQKLADDLMDAIVQKIFDLLGSGIPNVKQDLLVSILCEIFEFQSKPEWYTGLQTIFEDVMKTDCTSKTRFVMYDMFKKQSG